MDVAVIGAGIVGLATADALLRARPGSSVLVVDKEDGIARHQSGRNSGVIHSGLYYPKGSAKAELVATGRRLLMELCDEHGVAYDICGKVVVATSGQDLVGLDALAARATANGIEARWLDRVGLAELEPHVRGLAALHVPSAGIVDFPGVCRALRTRAAAGGSEVALSSPVTAIEQHPGGVSLSMPGRTVTATVVVNCAGLQSDRVARLAGARPAARITPFRGEYFTLAPERSGLVRNLVYPVPDPRFPFLGAHLTRSVSGEVHCGPNAVLALSREGYRWRIVDRADLAELAWFAGTWRLAARHWRTGLGEVGRSVSRQAFARALRRLVPDLSVDDLRPAPSGVRAQALDRRGRLLDDFAFADHGRVVSVVNAPSPAATASLAIGQVVAARVLALS